MTIISSQHHIDWEIVEKKMEEIKGFEKAVCEYLEDTKTNGAYEVMKKLI